jgi:hypothetical protein
MSIVRFEPIAVEIGKVVSLDQLLASDADGAGASPQPSREQSELPADVRGFLATYTATARGGWRLLGAPQFERLSRLHDRLAEEFMPGGPPMSPVYDSYATQHILCEVPQGLANETPYSVLARVTAGQARFEGVHALAAALAESFLDLYRVTRGEGFGAELVQVRGGAARSVRLTGPFAQTGDLMLARVLRVGDASFIADSPYLLRAPEQQWVDYFARAAGGEGNAAANDAPRVAPNAKLTPKQRARLQQRKAAGRQGAPEAAVVRHLKYGRSERYWLDYIMDGYDGERRGIVYLAGVPDRPETLPHRGLRAPN